MFYYSSLYTDPKGFAGTIRIKKKDDPRKTFKVIGTSIKDVDGNTWYLNGMIEGNLLARPQDQADLPSITNSYRTYTKYRTYKVEIVE